MLAFFIDQRNNGLRISVIHIFVRKLFCGSVEVILHNCRPLYKCVCYGMLNIDFFNNKIERFVFLIYITIVLAINYISSRMYRYQNDSQ